MDYRSAIAISLVAIMVFAVFWRLFQVDKISLARRNLLLDIAMLASRHNVVLNKNKYIASSNRKCYHVTISDVPFSLVIDDIPDGKGSKVFSDVLKFKHDNEFFDISWDVILPTITRGNTEGILHCDDGFDFTPAKQGRVKERNARKVNNQQRNIVMSHCHRENDRSYQYDTYRDSDMRTGHDDIVTTPVAVAAGVVVGTAINNDLEEMFGGGERYSDKSTTIIDTPTYSSPAAEPTPSSSWGCDSSDNSSSYDSGCSGD